MNEGNKEELQEQKREKRATITLRNQDTPLRGQKHAMPQVVTCPNMLQFCSPGFVGCKKMATKSKQ